MKQQQLPTYDHLPDDLIYSIMVMLPVKSLLRFRSLSRQWKDVITSPRFRVDHMHMQSRSPTTSFLFSEDSILYSADVNHDPLYICKTSLQTCCQSEVATALEVPFHLYRHEYDMIWTSSSCRGLFCFLYTRGADPFHISLHVLNPFTRRHRLVPCPKNAKTRRSMSRDSSTFLDLGYDPTIKRHKIVVMKGGVRVRRQIQVTELGRRGTLSWRTVDPSASCNLENLVRKSYSLYHMAVGENVYWIAKNKHDGSRPILKFNMVKECFTTLTYPSGGFDQKGESRKVRLGHYNGSLYLFYYSFSFDDPIPTGSTMVDVWMHDESNTAWKKVWTIPKIHCAGVPAERYVPIEPLGIAANGIILIRSHAHKVGIITFIPTQNKLVRLKFDTDIAEDYSHDPLLLDMETLLSPPVSSFRQLLFVSIKLLGL